MIPAVTFAAGGKLYLVKGGVTVPTNLTLVSDPAQTTALGGVNWNSALTDFYGRFWGGYNSYWPCSYANHKPGAFYYGKLYQALNLIAVVNSALFLSRFDGSGIFINGGSAGYSVKWLNGRGTQFISPSGGTTGDIRSHDLAAVVHNGVLFFVGNVYYSSTSLTTSNWIKKSCWATKNDAITAGGRDDRRYKSFAVEYNPATKKLKKLASSLTQFLPDSPKADYLHACDAVSFENNIYFANWIDIVRFPGGSGTPTIVENTSSVPSAKCFEIFPTSGYLGTSPSGVRTLHYLSGSGVLKSIVNNATRTIFDLKTKNPDVRTGGNLARLLSATAQPGRSPLLVNYNYKLHAFITSATSGYHHFVCNGNPASGVHWTDLTQSLPESFRRCDGNAFGFVDSLNNKMYVAHITMSEVDPWGHHGAQKSAGGIIVHKYNEANEWETINESMVGEVPRGFIPYQNLGPSAAVPSGSIPIVYQANDYAVVDYYLFDHYSRNVDVVIEYSIDLGLTWKTARRFKSYQPGTGYLGDALVSLTTSPVGVMHTFYWDYVNDISFNQIETCLVRIIPKLSR